MDVGAEYSTLTEAARCTIRTTVPPFHGDLEAVVDVKELRLQALL